MGSLMQPGLGTLACETVNRGPGLLGGFPETGREGPSEGWSSLYPSEAAADLGAAAADPQVRTGSGELFLGIDGIREQGQSQCLTPSGRAFKCAGDSVSGHYTFSALS